MHLNTGDVPAGAAVIEAWLNDQRARHVQITSRSDGTSAQTIEFVGGLWTGRYHWDSPSGISSGRLTIETKNGSATQVDGVLIMSSALPIAALWPGGIAIALAINGQFAWSLVSITMVFPVWFMLLATAYVGSFRTSLGRAINRAMSDETGRRGFEVMTIRKDNV